MEFPFTYDMTINGVQIAQIACIATIEPDEFGTPPSAHLPAWTVGTIEAWGTGLSFNRAGDKQLDTHRVEIPEGALLDRVTLQMLQSYRQAIDAAWAAHMGQTLAAARSRFAVPTGPKLVPANN